MNTAAIWILAVYTLANAGILWYFFIYKQNKADEQYDTRMKELRQRYNQEWKL